VEKRAIEKEKCSFRHTERQRKIATNGQGVTYIERRNTKREGKRQR